MYVRARRAPACGARPSERGEGGGDRDVTAAPHRTERNQVMTTKPKSLKDITTAAELRNACALELP